MPPSRTETLRYAVLSIDSRTVGQHNQLVQPNESSFYATKEELKWGNMQDSAPKDPRIGMDSTPPSPPSRLYMQLMVLGNKANGDCAERFLAGGIVFDTHVGESESMIARKVLEPSRSCVELRSIAV